MKFISVQPDQVYFIWQLEIQLRNFHGLGIRKEDIQVIASYDREKRLNPLFENFINTNEHLATFFTYPDIRESRQYTSSVRPNILRQHFQQYPELEQQTLFYHDSDILFSRIPQIMGVETNDICYVSDTRHYLGVDYIRRAGSDSLLSDMLKVVGLPKEKIEQEDNQTGGAQYILKGVTANFWAKVERDSEELYVLMGDYNNKLWEREYPITKEYRSKRRGIEAWCADMWAVLWNLWLIDKKVEVHHEMDFSWPFSPIEDWDKKAIQHYSGNIEDKTKFFKKGEYRNYAPWYDEGLLTIPAISCSYRIVEQIQQRREFLDTQRSSYPNGCIVLDSRKFIDAGTELEHYRLVKRYFQKHLAIDVYLLTDSLLQCEEQDKIVNTEGLMSMLSNNNYNRVLLTPLRYIIGIDNVQYILQTNQDGHEVFWTPKEIYNVDSLFTETFLKVLDIDLLYLNKGKFNTIFPTATIPTQLIDLSKPTHDRNSMLHEILHLGDMQSKTKATISSAYSLTM